MSESVTKEVNESLEIDQTAEWQQQFVRDSLADIQKAWTDNETWRYQRKIDYQYLYGLIGRQNPDMPYPGAPDIRDRWMLTAVHELMPKFVLPLFLAPHLAKFSGGGQSDSRMEDFYDTAFRYKIPSFLQVVQGSAFRLLAHPGNCVLKVSYDPKSHLQTKAENVPQDLKSRIESLDMQIRLAETQQAVEKRADELAPDEPQPGAEPTNQTPSAPSLFQLEQLRELPLQLVARRYKYDLEDDVDRKRAEDVLRQIRGDDDIVVAIIKRDAFPLKLSFIDQPTDFIVPKGTNDIQDAPWVAELQFYTDVQMRDAQASGKFKNVDEVLADSDKYNHRLQGGDNNMVPWERGEFDLLKNWVQGIMPDNDASLPGVTAVYEKHCWIPRCDIRRFNGEDDDGDETMVRGVVNIAPYADPAHAILRIMEHPNDFEGLFNWPYIQIRHFDTGEGFYCGKGLPFMSLPFVQEYLETHNAAVIRDILSSMPLFAWNARLMKNDTSTPEERRLPGQNFEVNGDPSKVLQIYQLPDLGAKMHADAGMNRQSGNRAMGIADAGALPAYDRPPNQMIAGTVTGPASDILRHEVQNWLDGWSKVFQMCHLLMKQNWWMDTTEQQRTLPAGEDGKMVTVTPKDFEPEYIIRAGGEPDLGDQQQLAVRAQSWLQHVGLNPQIGWMTDPAEWGPDISSIFVGATRTRKWLLPEAKRANAQQMFVQALAQAQAARTANKQKRQGASTRSATPQMPGANLGASAARL